GDVDGLVKRVEALHETLPDTLETAESRIRAAGRESADAIQQAGVASGRTLDKQGREFMQGVENASHETRKAAQAFHGTSRTLWAMVCLAIVAGAVAGGAVAVVMIKLG